MECVRPKTLRLCLTKLLQGSWYRLRLWLGLADSWEGPTPHRVAYAGRGSVQSWYALDELVLIWAHTIEVSLTGTEWAGTHGP